MQVVRCFEDDSVIHVEGSVDPAGDTETIQIELALADLAAVERRRDRAQKTAKSGDKVARAEIEVIEKLHGALADGKPARTVRSPTTNARRHADVSLNNEADDLRGEC